MYFAGLLRHFFSRRKIGQERYKVQSGGKTFWVYAEDPVEAAVEAVVLYNPRKLGFLMSCLRVGETEDKEMYVSTVEILRLLNQPVLEVKDGVRRHYDSE